MKYSLKITGLEAFKAGLADTLKNQIPFALSKAMNDTVSGARIAVQHEIKDSFDRPTPYILNSVRYEKADKNNLSASVYIADPEHGKGGISPARILAPHVFGGGREVKSSERRLRDNGFMGLGQWIVPGPGAPRDQYGNISGGQMQRILGSIKAFSEGGYNVTKKTGGHYVIPFVGVFRWTGRKVSRSSVPVLLFTYNAPTYEKDRFAFFDTFRFYVNKHFLPNLIAAWHYSVLRAR